MPAIAMNHRRIYRLYSFSGVVVYYLSIPLLYIYGRITKPRPRLLYIHDGKVLLVKNWFSEQKWTLPGGGVIKNENETAALVREIDEELGITIGVTQLAHLATIAVQRLAPYKISIYTLQSTSLPPRFIVDKCEIIATAWFPLTEIPTDRASELDVIVNLYKN